jgi:uncharacterized protein (DUF4415 family)
MNATSTPEKHSLSAVRAMRARGEDHTRADAPEAEALPDGFWDKARVVTPSGKTAINLRLDNDVLDWFKSSGRGHLTRMNAVLRAYVEAQGNHR